MVNRCERVRTRVTGEAQVGLTESRLSGCWVVEVAKVAGQYVAEML